MSPHAPPLHGSLPPHAPPLSVSIQVNGASHTTTACTVHDWLLSQGIAPESLATAVNGQFIPRAQRAQTPLAEGDSILTFQPIQGG